MSRRTDFAQQVKPIHFRNRQKWRSWLARNHDREKEVWLTYYKKHTRMRGVTHEEAVAEALCFGWIDSKVRAIDDERFMQKYTPRKGDSVWSLINKKVAMRMMREGKMAKAGLATIKAAKKSGRWSSAYTSRWRMAVPPDLKGALMENERAWRHFRDFANTYQNMYVGWVNEAKTEGTRNRRMREVVKRASRNQKPGMTLAR
jgi:uncharacterized protein YdeI (YjbR/CyaY-like superfamily)